MKKKTDDIRVAYIGHVAPFEPEFYNQPGFGRPGTLAQLGFIEALHNSPVGLDRAWGFRPISHWPHAKVSFEWFRSSILPCGAKLTLLPLVNHFFLREISRYIILALVVVYWSILRIGKKRILVVYNLTQPTGLVWMRIITWLTHTKLVPVIYDLAQMKMFKKSFLFRMMEPDWLDRVHEKMIPLCDGLMPITDAIPRDFAPKLKYLRVDGGVGDAVVRNLPELRCSTSNLQHPTFTIFYAGGVEPWNGIPLLLEYMRQTKDLELRLWIAGGGSEVSLVEDLAKKDPRVKYLGFLGPNELKDRYERCDILVTLRDLIDPGLIYHYPSKTFEMLAMGKPLVISNSSHTREMYGAYCKVIEKCDLESLRKGVDFFRGMTPEERLAYGKRAREYVLTNRKWSAWGAPIGEYLKTIV